MSKPTTNASKSLMNLLYKETASRNPATSSSSSSQLHPTLSNQLYSTTNESYELDFLNNISTKRKQNAHNLLAGNLKTLPFLSIKIENSFLNLKDFQNFLPFEKYLKYDQNPINQFEILKKRNDHLVFENEYFLFFKNRMFCLTYINEINQKILNGVPLKFQQYQDSAILKELIATYPHQLISTNPKLIKKLIPTTISEEPNTQIEEILQKDELNYKTLQQLFNFDQNSKSILIKNWPFGLKKSTIEKFLWNYNLTSEPLDQIYSNINLGINIIKLNFTNIDDVNRFWLNFNGLKQWNFLQHFGNVMEKKDYGPLICEII
ncbi:hypothetical protein KGF54_001484 [Candida jiufengensis]|uniref:uncharacterized protein n=1 Tax=Candida jiufengensis TaxID=497108 RepID=UPI0022246163|nr:uncharacterized protein KGF54_001484 [Candida jiufengensis]KAI5954923.1 hypothetical protein KGF54_001484 [Candida jiufengensis]